MSVRLAELSDLKAINQIYNQAVEEAFCTAHLEAVPMKERLSWFKDHPEERYPVFVAEREGQVAGWIALGAYRHDRQALAHVAEVSYYVHRHFRRSGVGTELMGHVLAIAPGMGFGVLIAILLGENLKSMAFLEKHGFQRWGTMPGIARIGKVRSDHVYYGLHLKE